MIWTGIVMGIAGTLAMDVWARVLNMFGQPLPNWGVPGRWLAQVRRGRVFHDDIAAVDPVEREVLLGWALHYAVGIAYGVAFVLLAGPGWVAAPTFWPVWAFSVAPLVFGWFLLQPGMGLGWAASRTPAPWKLRGLGLVAHTVFGLGMWGGALL